MADNPPQTLQLDQPIAPSNSGQAAPPQTLQLDEPVASPVAPPSQRGILENIVGGMAEGIGKTVTGIGNAVATGAEKLTGQPAGSLHATFADNREAPSTARDIGEGAENIAEFSAGLEGLEGFAKAAKITQMAKSMPLAAETLNMIKEHPYLAKIASETAKGATVGAAQGAAKGGAEGKTAEGAEGGALGGGIGGGAGAVIESAATPVAEAAAKKLGWGTSAVEDAKMAARPGKRNIQFADNFLRAAPHMDEVNAFTPAKTVEDWADNAAMAREILYKQKIQPLVDAHATEPLGGLNIANGIRSQIPNAMKQFAPEEAAKMEQLANQFMPQNQFHLNVADAEEALQHYNAQLTATGFWSKMPAEREALLKTNGEIAGLKAASDSLRDEFYGRLNQLAPDSNIGELKKDYGALRSVENEIRGRVNVNDRQAPMSLKETIGLITGIGTGNPVIAAVPFVDRMVNSPEKMLDRAVQKAARPGEEGAIAKTAQKVGKAAKNAAPEAGAVVGAQAGRIIFTASDGSTHSIPDNENALAHAKSIDPGLKIVQ